MLERIFLIGFLLSIPLLGSGCKPCCEGAGETKSTSTADGTPALTTANLGQPGCCSQKPMGDSPKSDGGDSPKAEKPTGDSPKATCCAKPKAATPSSDPARQLVFKVEGLTCPAAPGRGCGHRIAPVLARLDKVDGVEASAANFTGTLIRISVKAEANLEKVAEAVQKDLTTDKRNPVRLQRDELAKALQAEEWKAVSGGKEKSPINAASGKLDPARQLIFTVEGLTCPAVKGLGCGHRLAPVLARLNKIEGVDKSFTNRTGTMIRIALASSTDRDMVAAAARAELAKDNHKPVPLAGNELQAALAKEQWYTPGELSAIEFRTLALHRVKNFAEAEKLDKETTDRLMTIAEREWDRSVKADDGYGPEKQPGEWLNQFKRVAESVPAQAKELLSVEQAERLRQVLTGRFTEKDVPGSAERYSKE
jgi:hypothetical protein